MFCWKTAYIFAYFYWVKYCFWLMFLFKASFIICKNKTLEKFEQHWGYELFKPGKSWSGKDWMTNGQAAPRLIKWSNYDQRECTAQPEQIFKFLRFEIWSNPNQSLVREEQYLMQYLAKYTDPTSFLVLTISTRFVGILWINYLFPQKLLEYLLLSLITVCMHYFS